MQVFFLFFSENLSPEETKDNITHSEFQICNVRLNVENWKNQKTEFS